MNNHRQTLIRIWVVAYLCIIVLGYTCGLELIIFPILIILAVPPTIMHSAACSRVVRRAKSCHPEEWKKVGGALQQRYFLFDRRDFGDEVIASHKRDLRWWLNAGAVSISLYLPTLFTIAYFAKIHAAQAAP
jgi:hypothetical protein